MTTNLGELRMSEVIPQLKLIAKQYDLKLIELMILNGQNYY
jgi:hypothetical protein